jgi:MYXO-CTERM domain-containing protein
VCYDGTCRDDLCCDVTCDPGRTCDPATGTCTDRCAAAACAWPLACDPATGSCEEPACWDIECPAGYDCVDDTCVARGGPADDRDGGGDDGGGDGTGDATEPGVQVLATGAGGCSCRATGSGPGTTGLWSILGLAAAVLAVRSRRRSHRNGGKTMRWFRTLRWLSVLAALGLTLATACETQPYCVGGPCVEAGADDGGIPDGENGEGIEGDVNVDDGVVEGADGDADDDAGADADGEADAAACDGVDLMTDPLNCGTCGNRCAFEHAFNECVDGTCRIRECDFYYWDDPDLPGEDCLYYCQPRVTPGNCDATCTPTVAGGECDTTCNTLDDDCNGLVDDCVDITTDPENCGGCGHRCHFANATAECIDSVCQIQACAAGYWDADGWPINGCEYECTPADPPTEVCNNLDDDCIGGIDQGNPGGGAPCGETAGECSSGLTQCIDGVLECVGGTPPTPELCNNLDDDCDTVADNAPTDIGTPCGSDTGVCARGTWVCDAGGVRRCNGEIVGSAEVCNALDDDCDGTIDELPLSDTFDCARPGVCVEGTPLCDSGVWTCSGEIIGSPETCNGIDDDCDTVVDNGYNLLTDPLNCGTCGNRCTLPNAVSTCTAGGCVIASCTLDHWNVNGIASDGCEYACTRVAADYDTCNGRDDDCDTLTDASDPNFADSRPDPGVPDYFCNQTGPCIGATVDCGLFRGAIAWHCDYPVPVTVDATGTILPETHCDSIDEDCDGTTDENWPGVRHSAADPADACSAGLGICLRTGTFVCDAATTGQQCSVTAGTPGPTELCNGLDDNCDGLTDNFAETYFTATSGAAVRVSGNVDTNYPPDATRETARDFYVMRWEASRPDATAATAGSISNLRACSVNGVMPWTNVTQAVAESACCGLNAFAAPATRGACRGTLGATGYPAGSGWHLCPAPDWQLGCERYSAGYYLYPYGAAYVAATCNGNDYDTNATLAGDQDDILATQTMVNCRNPAPGFPPSNSWIWDASGNVKEWTATSRIVSGSTYYEIRGGASNNSSLGLTCPFNFTLGSTTFIFPNLGFRCCYYP